MARVLLTWELGGGLGHLMNLRPLAAELARRRHEVFLAAGDLARVPAVFGDLPVNLLPAPWKSRQTRTVQTIITFADLLLNTGFGDGDLFAAHQCAWRNLFVLVKPDLVICDHSPSALLAAWGQDFPIVTVGTGFFCPIDESPLRILRSVGPDEVPAVRAPEQRLLEIINARLSAMTRPSGTILAKAAGTGQSGDMPEGQHHLDRVTQLYHDGRLKHYLLTFPELDHFAGRVGGDYRGVMPYGLNGEAFLRPGAGPCVFAYLKPFPALADLMGQLAASEIGAVVYIDGWPEADKARYRTQRLRFANGPVDIRQAAENCDAALTNGNAATCTAMLLAGKPLVSVPPFLEQWLFAAAVERMGAGITANATDARSIVDALNRILAEPHFAEAAMAFADRHRNDYLDEVAPRIVDDLTALIR